jgi:hypothetical protein
MSPADYPKDIVVANHWVVVEIKVWIEVFRIRRSKGPHRSRPIIDVVAGAVPASIIGWGNFRWTVRLPTCQNRRCEGSGQREAFLID